MLQFFIRHSFVPKMPLSEIGNALFLTYIGTEYHAAFQKSAKSLSQFIRSFGQKRQNQLLLVGVISLNIFDRVTGVSSFLQEGLEQLYHAPKILLAALLYVTFLYYDCNRHVPKNSNVLRLSQFLRKVGVYFVKILPFYPAMAVLITVFFELFSELLEFLHLDPQWLNTPIYYGVLYGPFSTVYFQVKRAILEDLLYSIPTTTAGMSTSAISGCCRIAHREGKEEEKIIYKESDYFNPKIDPLPKDFVPRNYGINV